MVRDDDSNFLLYMHPRIEDKSSEPINDELVTLMRLAMSEAIPGTANYSAINDAASFRPGDGWRGWHSNCDDIRSDNHDYLLINGLITNSLCVHYLMWFRNAISKNDLNKIKQLQKYYGRTSERKK